MSITALLFLITALIYASVGLGGGSTYTALLVIFDTPYLLIPTLSLVCNIIVVMGGTWRFHRNRLIPWKQVWPLFIASVPMAWLGGSILIDKSTFTSLLAITLVAAGIVMLLESRSPVQPTSAKTNSILVLPLVGAILGFISGMVGIGGGIFLAPVLHFLNWQTSKIIAGVCSSFILINSVAGLVGHSGKFGSTIEDTAAFDYWPLFLAVLIGGQLGSIIGINNFKAENIKVVTALLVLFVGARLLLNSWIKQ